MNGRGGHNEPIWQSDKAEQCEFLEMVYGQEAADVFMRGGTMALCEYEDALPDKMPDVWVRDPDRLLRRRDEPRRSQTGRFLAHK